MNIIDLGTGKQSWFGGPADEGVGPSEGLALVGPSDLGLWWWASLFLPQQPEGTTGLARRLNPRAFYLAMRWDYARFSKELLRNTVTLLRNPATGLFVFARPVDYGPGDGKPVDGQATVDTGRLFDLSPAAQSVLGLQTDELVSGALILP